MEPKKYKAAGSSATAGIAGEYYAKCRCRVMVSLLDIISSNWVQLPLIHGWNAGSNPVICAMKSRCYGPNGTDRDEFGLLPEKEIIGGKMRAVSMAPKGAIANMLDECIKQGETPTKVMYGGPRWNTTMLGLMNRGKYFSLELVNDPTMDYGELEMI